MTASGWRQNLKERLSFGDKRWSDFGWWLGTTIGAGLMQVWLLLLLMLALIFWPDTRQQFGIHNWGISRILGNSVLIFFATSLIGQAIYTLYKTKGLARRRRRNFAVFFIGANFIFVMFLYVLTVLFGESPVRMKYAFDILFAVLALLYAAYVEFGPPRASQLANTKTVAVD